VTEELRGIEEEIRDLLPDEYHGSDRRSTMSREDILKLAIMIKRLSPQYACSIGFSADEAGKLRTLLKWVEKAFALVGFLVITAIVGVIIAIFSKGFWGWIKIGGK
jgi:hypothetical protein